MLKYIEPKKNKKFTRRELLIGFVALLAVAVNFLFPQKAYGETFWLSLFLFAVFPAVVAARVLKEPLENFGLTQGKMKTGVIFAVCSAIGLICLNYFLLFHTKYGGELTIARFIIGSFTAFLLFEIFIALPLHFFWEFFFRGFLQMGLEKKMGIYSLLLAAVLQTTLSLRESWTAILLVLLSSLFAGLIVRRSRSIIYSALALWLVSMSLDIMIIRLAYQAAG